MKKLQHKHTLFYCDGIQLFEAQDAIGGRYIAVLVDSTQTGDEYMAIGVPPEVLRRFKNGAIDLHTALLSKFDGTWFKSNGLVTLDGDLVFSSNNTAIPPEYLPDTGFILHGHAVESDVINQARTASNLALEVSIEPPETANDHQISVNVLVDFLGIVGRLFKYGSGHTVRSLNKESRRLLPSGFGNLNVLVPAATGSFRVILSPSFNIDLLGESEANHVMQTLHDILEKSANTNAIVSDILDVKGHLAASYAALFEFLQKNQTAFRYSWAMPGSETPTSGFVTYTDSLPIIEKLKQIDDLGKEPVTIVGRLSKIDIVTRTWRLIDSAGKHFSGKVSTPELSLSGLVTDAIYSFDCDEVIEYVGMSGKERHVLYLSKFSATSV